MYGVLHILSTIETIKMAYHAYGNSQVERKRSFISSLKSYLKNGSMVEI